MKLVISKLATLSLLAVAGLLITASAGCSSPGYSGGENVARDLRNAHYDLQQLDDDVAHALLLRPASTLTKWNVLTQD